MKKFATVEDYLEVIAGYRDIESGKVPASYIFIPYTPIINLARYDVSVLETMSATTLEGKTLTERQGELACKIILKYERQLAHKGVDVSPVKLPVWRAPLRKMDYSRQLYIENDTLILRFPYDNQLIEQVRSFSKDSQGRVLWDKENKMWTIGLTEYNLSWLHAWTSQLQFTIADDVAVLMQKIQQAEMHSVEIELTIIDDQMTIVNASDSLHNYIIDNLGGFDMSNLLRLVDMSSVLGYTIDKDIVQALVVEHGHKFCSSLINKEIKLNPTTLMTSGDLESIIEYAEKLNRLPVVIYEPDLSNRLLNILSGFGNGNCVSIKNKKSIPESFEGIKYIHTVVPIYTIPNIPLLISGAGMMFGGDKQLMIQQAEKVVYCATDIYNKKK